MIPQEEEKFTPEQLKIMKTQDSKYVEMKYRVEKNVRVKGIQWNPSNPDTIGIEESVLIREVPLFQGLKSTQA